MIEDRILTYLNQALQVPSYTEEQAHMPGSFILLQRTGGSESDYLKRAMVAIQSYAESLYKAASLNNELVNAMYDFADYDSNVSSVRLNSDYNFTDTNKKKYRYQAVFEIYYFD